MTTNGIRPIGTQPSHGALGEDLNLDPKEAASRAGQAAKDTWVGSVAGGVAPKEMTLKKFLFCAAGTALMVFGISHLGKNTNMFKKLGEFGDDLWARLSKNQGVADFSKKVSGFFSGIKTKLTKPGSVGEKVSNNFKAIFGKNTDGMNNVVRPKNSWARPMIFGTKWEVVDNALDPLQAMLKKPKPNTGLLAPVRKFFRTLTQGSDQLKAENTKKFKELLTKGGCPDVDGLCKRIANLGGDVDDKFSVYKDIKKYLKPEDIAGTSELFSQRVHGFKVGFFDSIRRAEMINNAGDGQALYGAKTGLGRLLQKGLFRGMEAPSNGVASRGIMPYSIALPIYWGVFNKVYDTKKGEKVSKFAEESVSDMGNYMMIPVTAGTMYAAASLKYFGANATEIKTYKDAVKNAHALYAAAGDKAGRQAAVGAFKTAKAAFGKTGSGLERLLRKPAEILGMGLEGKPGSVLSGKAGGALRLVLYMFLLSPLFIKPVKKLCHTIFGKPSDTKAEEDQKKQEKLDKKQAKANQIAFVQKLRELNMTQEDLANQLAQRPDIVQRLQTDTQLAQNLDKNPLLLFDLLATAPQQGTVPPQPQQPAAPAQPQGWPTQPAQPTAPAQPAQPTAPAQPAQPVAPNSPANPPRTYIPSSAPVVQGANMSPDQQSKLSALYANADRAEAEAMKFL